MVVVVGWGQFNSELHWALLTLPLPLLAWIASLNAEVTVKEKYFRRNGRTVAKSIAYVAQLEGPPMLPEAVSFLYAHSSCDPLAHRFLERAYGIRDTTSRLGRR